MKIMNDASSQNFCGLARFGRGYSTIKGETVINTDLIKEYKPFVENYGLHVTYKNGEEHYCIDRVPFVLYNKTILTAIEKGNAVLEYVNKGLCHDEAIKLYNKGIIPDLEKGFFNIISE